MKAIVTIQEGKAVIQLRPETEFEKMLIESIHEDSKKFNQEVSTYYSDGGTYYHIKKDAYIQIDFTLKSDDELSPVENFSQPD